MTAYLDTSLLVTRLANEAATSRVWAWSARQEIGSLVISDWVATEVAAGLSIKMRTGDVTP